MMLLLDLGNTRLKWSCYDGARLEPMQALMWREADLDAELSHHWCDLAPSRVVLCSVAPETVCAQVQGWVARHWGVPLQRVRSSAVTAGVRNGYRQPERLGADRWAALVAAWCQYQQPLCYASCGSALTLDCIDAKGRHLGGQIFPGLVALRRSLSSDLELSATAGEPRWLATGTEDGVIGGTLYGLVAVVEQFIGSCEQQLDSPLLLMMSGGDAPQLLPLLQRPALLLPDLVLQGCAILAEA